MTTSVKVSVNGRYRATVTHKNATGGTISKTIVHGNYEGSPNQSGEETFHLAHPGHGIFEVTEAQVAEEPNRIPPNIDRNAPGPGSVQDPNAKRPDETDEQHKARTANLSADHQRRPDETYEQYNARLHQNPGSVLGI